jgi:hypothetical protein
MNKYYFSAYRQMGIDYDKGMISETFIELSIIKLATGE